MPPTIVSIVGFSNSGKTTLAVALIASFKARGYKLGVIKHAAHGFDMDRSGKDSYKHKQAGADAVVVASAKRIALVKDVQRDMSPVDVARAYFPDMDLVLVEGYKKEDLPKIEVMGFDEDPTPHFGGHPKILATVSLHPPAQKLHVPHFSFDQADELADFLIEAGAIGDK
ncbi:molybdopterin guanine dinucleotide biosynthesis accessory protein MobB [Desulfatibacillum alkenivorans DSM 16219]|jgi:molybdopterin-guanine dinucleotide biosynthesis protein B|uniref:Molybdopterin guanine dinucleotide biosynthesis accessory protein MobB n=1 Tax=Desulfatibacillum alkenivorans DSM 16219 TaxID=1121393 RepID=A0A1M6YYM7_9BACT|nr:molybdopterin-guanine dinucleotide biosynthesis protein B [Desulfatibacillum alkenivorans]SHL23404.1 molybdopterin guanine dinucleotide biosynthesis accessory protein MobB [Desulfatibacillum alkenivorans DSM 16219]